MAEWTTVDVPQQPVEETDEGVASARFMEAVVRVTAAGFAGALVGLSHQKRAAGAKIFQRSVLHNNGNAAKRKLPPTAPKLRSAQSETNLPLQWATSFGAFVSILETSHFWSPSTLAMNLYYDEHLEDTSGLGDLNGDDNDSSTQQQQPKTQDPSAMTTTTTESTQTFLLPEQYRQSVTTICDYTLGGAVAGMAGGMSKRRPPPTSSSTSQLQLPSSILKSGRRSILLSGIGTGVILGFIAGVCQAGLDVAEDYVRAEGIRQEEEFELQKQIRREQSEQKNAQETSQNQDKGKGE